MAFFTYVRSRMDMSNSHLEPQYRRAGSVTLIGVEQQTITLGQVC